MRRIVYIPTLALAATLVLVYLSGNDKAPFLLPAPLALSVVVAIVQLAKPSTRRLVPVLTALFPWFYVVIAVVLSRAGLVSSLYTLGFR